MCIWVQAPMEDILPPAVGGSEPPEVGAGSLSQVLWRSNPWLIIQDVSAFPVQELRIAVLCPPLCGAGV